mmetsp:Transcript_20838/g.53253  ORF Transcript_20838/g.53253 Transcript_20838/m.53253 type:complete len:211 (+) Transcript_20838:524-1156(+)
MPGARGGPRQRQRQPTGRLLVQQFRRTRGRPAAHGQEPAGICRRELATAAKHRAAARALGRAAAGAKPAGPRPRRPKPTGRFQVGQPSVLVGQQQLPGERELLHTGPCCRDTHGFKSGQQARQDRKTISAGLRQGGAHAARGDGRGEGRRDGGGGAGSGARALGDAEASASRALGRAAPDPEGRGCRGAVPVCGGRARDRVCEVVQHGFR